MLCKESTPPIIQLNQLQEEIAALHRLVNQRSEIPLSCEQLAKALDQWLNHVAKAVDLLEQPIDHTIIQPSDRVEPGKVSAHGLEPIVRQEQILFHKVQAIHRCLSLRAVFDTTLQLTCEHFQADWVMLVQYHPREQTWQQLTQLCANHTELPGLYLSDTHLAGLAQALDAGPGLYSHAMMGERHQIARAWAKCYAGQWLWLPLRAEDEQIWGMLAVGYRQIPLAKMLAQLEPLEQVTEAASVAIYHNLRYQQLHRVNQELQALASTDSLTQLANRRHFDRHFTSEWQRLTREQKPISLILCDIDHFKRYNDHYGHPQGDQCLVQVAQVLHQASKRPADLAARYGGEEFALILPNTDTAGAHRVAQSIRHAIRALAIPHATTELGQPIVTVTMGIATSVPSREMEEQDLIQAADLALYHAKHQGRDRIYVHAHYIHPPRDLPKALGPE
jgi:diguanylate cyclase (GGDEF)-like protein